MTAQRSLVEIIKEVRNAGQDLEAHRGCIDGDAAREETAVKELLKATHTVGGLLARDFEVVEYEHACGLGEYARFWQLKASSFVGDVGGAVEHVKCRWWTGDCDTFGWSDWRSHALHLRDLKHQALPLTFAEADVDPRGRWTLPPEDQ